jgi:hypothetical protein
MKLTENVTLSGEVGIRLRKLYQRRRSRESAAEGRTILTLTLKKIVLQSIKWIQ